MSCELIVYTAAALSEDTARHLEEELSRRFGVSCIMFITDPALIGGMKLAFRDRIEDYSVQEKLRAIKAFLTKEQQERKKNA